MWCRPLEWNLNGTTDPRDGSVDHLLLNSLKDRHGPIRAPKSPKAEPYVFADSTAAVHALADAWRDHGSLPPLGVLVEVGAGRAGARSLGKALEVVSAVRAAGDRLTLAGVAAYEGSATQPTPEQTEEAISGLLKLSVELWQDVREATA